MNVYLIEDEGGGVTMFEAGIKAMVGRAVRRRLLARRPQPDRARPRPRRPPRRGAGAAGARSSATRPTASTPRATAACTTSTISQVSLPARWTIPRLLPVWDGGPVAIAGTVEEGDDVSGFRVVHIPGHSPGHDRAVPRVRPRRADGRLLLHARPRHRPPRPAAGAALRLQPRHRAGARLDPQDRGARAVGRVARATPTPVTGDVRAQLERAASET